MEWLWRGKLFYVRLWMPFRKLLYFENLKFSFSKYQETIYNILNINPLFYFDISKFIASKSSFLHLERIYSLWSPNALLCFLSGLVSSEKYAFTFTPTLSVFENLNDWTFIIKNWLLSRLSNQLSFAKAIFVKIII